MNTLAHLQYDFRFGEHSRAFLPQHLTQGALQTLPVLLFWANLTMPEYIIWLLRALHTIFTPPTHTSLFN